MGSGSSQQLFEAVESGDLDGVAKICIEQQGESGVRYYRSIAGINMQDVRRPALGNCPAVCFPRPARCRSKPPRC